METSRAWSRAAAGDNIEAILDYWADDALVISPGMPPLRGKPAIRTYLEQSRKAPGFRIGWEPREASLSAGGDMGYLVEDTKVSLNGPDGRPVTQHYRGLTIWRKQADGAWKNVVDISNAAPAAERAGP
jgi:ketosteroid isomerase-like protein